MKIHIREKERCLNLTLPTNLIFSRLVLGLALRHGESYGLPPKAAATLSREIRRIKKKHGTRPLVEVVSSDSERFEIIL